MFKRKIIALGIISLFSLNSISLLAYDKVDKNITYKPKTIAIDAGHYWAEDYKSSPDGYLEVKYNLAISKLVKQYIEENRPYVRVIETNPNGTNTERGKRGQQAKNAGAEFLLSLHMDAIGNTWQNKVYGTHIIVDNDSSKYTINLAKNIIDSYSSKTGIPLTRITGIDIRPDGKNQITLLDTSTKLGMPAMLIEMSFMDNPAYSKKFRDSDYQKMIAKAIATSLIECYIDKTTEIIELPIEDNNTYDDSLNDILNNVEKVDDIITDVNLDNNDTEDDFRVVQN